MRTLKFYGLVILALAAFVLVVSTVNEGAKDWKIITFVGLCVGAVAIWAAIKHRRGQQPNQ